ncbi:hypothetical protein [Allomuricauda sp. d1]|uniref:hypothetical protein n=1 Tax=Allomuricauda sp. d1 TaxID=3136725 RepID=UPI0031E34540
MEENIENLTSQTLTIDFTSSDESSSKTLQILPNEIEIFQESFDVGSTFHEAPLVEYDSVVIQNRPKYIQKTV